MVTWHHEYCSEAIRESIAKGLTSKFEKLLSKIRLSVFS